ncbi:DUF4097 family beta strand repeat-containing protein [Nonomuraea sp. NPDC003804]|uniref:DUF4097 family beta strand repeat-containing protein n=1 Tax=Nonomuraea sp. NPDC003804 TaxID=3154547 RepID=UPI0033BC46FA
MPVFSTPEPVTAHVDIPAGQIRISASDRDDTHVEVRPADPGSPTDIEYAQDVVVEHADGVITVKAPDRQRFRRAPALHVSIALPSRSDLRATTASADVIATGELREVAVDCASGDVTVAHAVELGVKSASGDVRCDVIESDAIVDATSGNVRLGTVGGGISVVTASGDTVIGHAGGGVGSRSASGDLVVESVARGRVGAESASGDIRIAIAEGSAAWLEVSSLSGRVRSELRQSEQPAESVDKVEVRARTLSGDIAIVRATGSR